MQKKTYPKKRPGKKKGRKSRRVSIRAGADQKLAKVFSCIGTPEKKPFKPDAFQLEATEAVENSDCLVTAPTGSGKTWIAEEAIRMVMKRGGKTWYGTPLKALTNTLYAQFKDEFGANNVGILTGDRKENPDAPLIIGTTEILRNQLYDAMHTGEDMKCDFVILDEAHFLGDPERGVVWEEIMIYLPVRMPLLMLSATIGNAYQIAEWLESIRGKKCVVVEETKRPVPLYPLFIHPTGTLFPLVSKKSGKGKTGLYSKVAKFTEGRERLSMSERGKLPPIGEIIKVLKHYDLLPAIFFMKSRRDCDTALELCSGEILANDPERKEKLSQRVYELAQTSPHIAKHRQRWLLENIAAGSHHSGQLPVWKVVVETLMAEGLLDAMFATSTVSAGVNFPARTVVLLNSDRFNGTEFLPLTPTEFQQMTGRSGRRGKDNIGFAVAVPGRFMDIKLLSHLYTAPPSHVLSQIRIDFSMVLNLLLSHSPEQINELLDKSFASYLITSGKLKKRARKIFGHDLQFLWQDFLHHLDFLQQEGFVTEDGNLTEDGIWASQLRIDTPLLVAEGLRNNIFPEKSPVLLAALMASFVDEREFDDEHLDRTRIPKDLLKSYMRIKKELRPFAKNMAGQGFDVRPLSLQPAYTIYSWASGQPWEKVVKLSHIAEGDLARLVMRTADNLRHFKNLRDVFPGVAESSAESIELIMKEPVVSYYNA